jgi:hypothetical protein
MTTRTIRGLKAASKDVEKYLKENGIPYLKIDDSINLVVLRNSTASHYCTIEFYELGEGWFEKKKPFTFHRIVSRKAYQILELIKKYLSND